MTRSGGFQPPKFVWSIRFRAAGSRPSVRPAAARRVGRAPLETRTPATRLLLVLLALAPIGARAATLVLANANIYTAGNTQARAEAVIATDGKIAFVGTTAEARRRAPADARTIDLRGATVLPGLVDAHAHLESEWRGNPARRQRRRDRHADRSRDGSREPAGAGGDGRGNAAGARGRRGARGEASRALECT